MASKLQPDQSNDMLYVKKGNMYCGYRREYLSQNLTKMEEGFVTCKKCSGIMREASLSDGNTSCLVCSETPQQPNPVKDVQESIEMLGIKCPLLEHCKWEGELSEAETHLKECLFFQIHCEECDQIFPRKDREQHQKKSCPKRVIYCDYCLKRGKTEDKDRHLQFCDEFPMSCPNECGAEFPRRQLSLHRISECELEVVTCPYKENGCGAKSMLRKDLLAHKKEFYIEHLDMNLVKMNSFQSGMEQMKTENACLKNRLRLEGKTMKQLDGIEWEIKNIDSLKFDEEVEGPTFYINNYKLRIYYIFRGLCNNFNLYLKRIEGEFDNDLGLAFVTYYRVIKVNKQDYSESECVEGTMNYQLKIGTKSTAFGIKHIGMYRHLLRFYFDTNYNPLESLAVKYSKDSPRVTEGPHQEHDPWKIKDNHSDDY